MDTRDTPEQAELRRTARRLARELGPRIVADLDDRKPPSASPRRCATPAGSSCARTVATAIRSPAGSRRPSSPTRWRGRRRRPVRGPAPRRGSRPPGGRAPIDGGGGRLLARPDRCRGGVEPDDQTRRSSPSTVPRRAPSRRTSWSPSDDGYRLALVTAEAARDGADLTRAIRTASGRLVPAARFATSRGGSRAPTSRRGRRSAWRSPAPTWSGSCGACSTSR